MDFLDHWAETKCLAVKSSITKIFRVSYNISLEIELIFILPQEENLSFLVGDWL